MDQRQKKESQPARLFLFSEYCFNMRHPGPAAPRGRLSPSEPIHRKQKGTPVQKEKSTVDVPPSVTATSAADWVSRPEVQPRTS